MQDNSGCECSVNKSEKCLRGGCNRRCRTSRCEWESTDQSQTRKSRTSCCVSSMTHGATSTMRRVNDSKGAVEVNRTAGEMPQIRFMSAAVTITVAQTSFLNKASALLCDEVSSKANASCQTGDNFRKQHHAWYKK